MREEERPYKEEVDGGNTHDVGDESGGAEGSELVAKTNHDDR